MKASASYMEISNWVGKRFRISPAFRRMDENTLEVSYKLGSFIPTVRMAFKIEAVRKDIICLSYDCSMPVSMLIAGAVGHLQNKIPNGLEIKPEEKRINIYLGKIEKLQKALEHAELTGLSFGEEEACVILALI